MDPFRQRLCIWAGPLSVVCAMVGLSFAGFALPLSSQLDPLQVVAVYHAHLGGIRIAAVSLLFCSAFMMIFAGAIAAQLQRIEGAVTPWVFVQMAGGVMGNVPFALTGIIWTATALRLDRPPAVTQAMNDIAAFVLELPAPTAIIQFLAIIFVVLGDKSKNPIFPKWVGYLNILVSLMFLPGVVGGVFVRSKAFDWNGFVSYSLPGMASSLWVVLMFIALLRANRRAAT